MSNEIKNGKKKFSLEFGNKEIIIDLELFQGVGEPRQVGMG